MHELAVSQKNKGEALYHQLTRFISKHWINISIKRVALSKKKIDEKSNSEDGELHFNKYIPAVGLISFYNFEKFEKFVNFLKFLPKGEHQKVCEF